jgi:hypothetical protein
MIRSIRSLGMIRDIVNYRTESENGTKRKIGADKPSVRVEIRELFA